jgi:hypothetical protein
LYKSHCSQEGRNLIVERRTLTPLVGSLIPNWVNNSICVLYCFHSLAFVFYYYCFGPLLLLVTLFFLSHTIDKDYWCGLSFVGFTYNMHKLHSWEVINYRKWSYCNEGRDLHLKWFKRPNTYYFLELFTNCGLCNILSFVGTSKFSILILCIKFILMLNPIGAKFIKQI